MIYYVSSTGQVIGGTAGSSIADLAGITHISGGDFAIFIDDATVASINPNNFPGTLSMNNIVANENFNQYSVPTATGVLQFTEQPIAEQIANAQSSQINLLRQGYAKTMASGFNATVGTTQYTFGWSTDDKSNLDLTQTSIDRGFLQFPIQYSDIHGSPVTLSAQTDLDTIEQTATKFFNAQHQQILTLIGQVQAATSVSQAESIVWSEASY